jgi:hypothetical protein
MVVVALAAVCLAMLGSHFFSGPYRYDAFLSRHHALFPTILLKVVGITW